MCVELLPHFGVSTEEEFMGVCAAILGARFESVTLLRVKKGLVDCGDKLVMRKKIG